MGPDPRASARVVIKFYTAFQFFFSLLLWLPIFYEFQRRIGLGDGEIFRIQSLYYLAFCLWEIPTGQLADRWSYRGCLILGGLTLFFAHLLPPLWPSYDGMLLHFMGVALARSFVSGASSAYLYDWLASRGEASRYRAVEGRARSVGLAGKVVCWAFVGALFEWHISAPYWLTAGAALVSVGFALALPPLSKRLRTPTQVWALVPELGALLRRQPLLLWLILQGVAVFVLSRIVEVNLFQPLLLRARIPVLSHGAILSAMTLVEALGSGWLLGIPGLRPGLWSRVTSISLMTAALGGTIFILAAPGAVAVVSGFLLFSWIIGWVFPIQKQLMNDALPAGDAHLRATVLSLESLIDRLGSAFAASAVAVALSRNQMTEFLWACGWVTLGVIAVLTLLRTKIKRH